MDVSKEYILMCEKAEEIQKGWEPQIGDYFLCEHRVWCIGDATFYFYPSGPKEVPKRIKETLPVEQPVQLFEQLRGWGCEENKIWLPRQDQLQEMVSYSIWYEKLYRFYDWLQKENYSGNWITGCNKYDSMEQLWLAFIMKELYQKYWSGEKWEKEKHK